MKQKNYYGDIIHLLQDLKKKHSSCRMAQHLAIALADTGDFWGLTDNELLVVLETYQAELELDVNGDPDIEKIIEDGEKLFDLPEENEEDY